MLEAAGPYEREHVFPNHQGKATEFVVKHIPHRLQPAGASCSHRTGGRHSSPTRWTTR